MAYSGRFLTDAERRSQVRRGPPRALDWVSQPHYALTRWLESSVASIHRGGPLDWHELRDRIPIPVWVLRRRARKIR